MNKKNISQSQKVEFPICTNCNSSDYVLIWDDLRTWEYKGVFRIVKCSNCDLIFLNPRPILERIGKYYQTDSYWGRDINKNETNSNFQKERQVSYGHLYSLINKFKKKGSILDIGAGTGMFLSYFKELGWHVDGLDLSKAAVNYAKKEFNIHLKCGDFQNYNFSPKTFDVISLNNSLEHLYNPFKTLQKIKRIIKDDGLLIITIPNIESVGAKIFGKHWRSLDPPRHLYHFSEKTIIKMLHKAGFEKLGSNHWYWVHNYYSIFESFRYNISPRFALKKEGGLANIRYKKKFSLKKEVGKIFFSFLSGIIAVIGSATKKSEVFTIYAVKQN